MLQRNDYSGLGFRPGARCDIGRVRKTNQDVTVVYPELGFFAVSDGMGGLSGGEQAAELVKEAIPKMMDMAAEEYKTHRDTVRAALTFKTSVQLLSDKLYSVGNTEKRFVYGATFCGVWLLDGKAIFVNLGDSRAYILRRYKKLPEQISTDHNLAALLVNNGKLSREEAKLNPYMSAQLTAFMGMTPEATPEAFTVDVRPGDRLLLCSDGLYGMVEERELARIMRSSRSPDRVCERLVERANQNGGRDNISAVYIKLTA